MSILKVDLEGILNGIPIEWELTSGYEAALIRFLESRANKLPEYIEQRLQKAKWWL